jgi:prepilin-type processing-associated H-X9-DG protein
MSDNQYCLSWLARILPFIDQQPLNETVPTEYARIYYPWGMAATGPNRPHIGLGTEMSVFRCPHESRRLINTQVDLGGFITTIAFTSYLGNSGTQCGADDGVLFESSAVRLDRITDGASNTLLAGERPPSTDLWFGWWYAGAGYLDPKYGQVGVGDVILGTREVVYASDPYQQLGPLVASDGIDCRNKVTFQPGNVNDPCDQVHYWSEHPGGANFVFADGAVRFLTYAVDKIMPALATRAGEELIGNLDD